MLASVFHYIIIFRFWVFRSWGRIGTTIGGNKCDKKSDLHEALAEFEALYEEKTGNSWKNRSTCEKVPGRMYPIDIDYGQVCCFLYKFHFIKLSCIGNIIFVAVN